MTPIKHPMCNDVLRKPPGMTEEECRDLHIRRDDGWVWSFWTPNAEELVAINRGGTVALCVMGATHPPLSIHATHPHETQDSRPVNGSEYRHRMEAVNGRMSALVALTKRIVAAWVSSTADSPVRRKLTDRFLDMLNTNKADGSLVETVPTDDAPTVTQSDVDRYRADAEGWKSEAERWRKVAEAATATDGQRTFDAGGWMNECLNAEAGRDTERELHHAAEQNLKNLLHYVEDRPGHVPVSGNAVAIRNALIQHNRKLAVIRVLVTDENPNPSES